MLQYPHPASPQMVVLAAKLQPPTPSPHGRPPEAKRVIRAPTSQAAAVGKQGPDIGRHAAAGPYSAQLLTRKPSCCCNITTPPDRGRSFALRTAALTPRPHGSPPEAQRVIRAPPSQAAAVGKRGPNIGRPAAAGPFSSPMLVQPMRISPPEGRHHATPQKSKNKG